VLVFHIFWELILKKSGTGSLSSERQRFFTQKSAFCFYGWRFSDKRSLPVELDKKSGTSSLISGRQRFFTQKIL
jgi:hypothetical protein